MKTRIRFVALILSIFVSFNFFLSCQTDSRPTPNSNKTYTQNIKTDVAWIVLEWNGEPFGYGSGFLVNREEGTFYTNRHVRKMFDTLGKNSHKLFFNGKVYRIDVDKTFQMDDAAMVRIIDHFDSSEFPEPAKFAKEELKLGDTVFIGGMHPHPHYIREADIAEGFDYPIIPVYAEYYNKKTKNLSKEQEIVLEKISGKVVQANISGREAYKELKEDCQKLNQNLSSEDNEDLRNMVNTYIKVQISKDHKFSFGGLSGSPVKNASGEIVGILTLENPCSMEYDKDKLKKKGRVPAKHIYNTVYLVPIKSVEGQKLSYVF